MFHDWSEFYLFAGGAAAVLIGLIFVVISLTQDHSRSAVLAGSKLYMGPIVLSLSFTLVLSAIALVPEIDADRFALVSGIVALWGLGRSIMSAVGIWRRGTGNEVHWTDAWFYGVIPGFLYLLLLGVAFAFGRGRGWATDGLHPDRLRRGVGRALLEALLKRSVDCGFGTMIAVVGGAEPASVALHVALGFREVGRLKAVGFKFGRWLDSVYLQRGLPDS